MKGKNEIQDKRVKSIVLPAYGSVIMDMSQIPGLRLIQEGITIGGRFQNLAKE